ncbi:MAG: diaminopimelate decarboxylase, partial [Actinomycetota bacterium]
MLNPKIWPKTATRREGVVRIGDCSVKAIAAKYGTPIFVLDELDLLERATYWRDQLQGVFGEKSHQVYFAAKSFISVEVAKLIAEIGIGIDVCTGGELAVARAANFPGERIEMHGN